MKMKNMFVFIVSMCLLSCADYGPKIDRIQKDTRRIQQSQGEMKENQRKIECLVNKLEVYMRCEFLLRGQPPGSLLDHQMRSCLKNRLPEGC